MSLGGSDKFGHSEKHQQMWISKQEYDESGLVIHGLGSLKLYTIISILATQLSLRIVFFSFRKLFFAFVIYFVKNLFSHIVFDFF